ncbi:MAG TPA: proton-conducting transporter membrane subunit, partial [Chloroflexota bacterium]|nr:proton-conducting transporter membrane subunit [Chloroflexota bacterium]
MLIISLLALPLATAILCRAFRAGSIIAAINAAGAFATLCAGLAVVARVFAGGPLSSAGELLYVDQLSAVLIVVIVVLDFAAALYSIGYLDRDIQSGHVPPSQLPWYYCGYHAFIWTMLMTVVVNNLGLLWVAIEATTLVSALLVGFHRTPAALEAAWKYLILCTVGIVIALFGVLLTYYASTQSPGGEAGLEWTVLMR